MTSVPVAQTAHAAQQGLHSMNAAVLEGPRQARTTRTKLPAVGPHDVRIRVEGCGVCASSIPLWEGREWFTYPQEPGIPGHEAWGVVDSAGPMVSRFVTGQRVAAVSHRALAEFDVAHENALVRIPDAFAGRPVPGEALGCVMNVAHRAQIAAGQHVAIIGIGFMGALLTQLCTAAGARVIAISRRAFSLELAARLGATCTLMLRDNGEVADAVRQLTGASFCERVIECTGSPEPLTLAGELIQERGRLVIAGYHQDGPRNVNMWLWNWRGIDVINAHERDTRTYVAGIERAFVAIQAGRMNPWPLITHRYSLGETGVALASAGGRPEGFVKGWVEL